MAEQTNKTTSTKSSGQTQNQTTESNVNPGSASEKAMSGRTGKPNQMSEMKGDKGDGLTQHVRSTASEAYDSATSKATEKLEEQKVRREQSERRAKALAEKRRLERENQASS